MATIDALTEQLSSTKMAGEGVSFAGKSLKLNNASDAKVVVDAIGACQALEYLDLEGNTLGVEAAKAIGIALNAHSELKRALWKDMFTGRLKNEIPQALRFLGSGLDVSGARLVELDLSDNAFGPIGMEGLASLLRSTSCHTLQILRLNNNGLGCSGARLLSKALLDCYKSSKSTGKPLPLRVFIAGRNRLENEGITALSNVFKILGSLEEIQVPQNGIYHQGVSVLSDALSNNTGLRILNLNDNTVGRKGCEALAKALNRLQQLRTLNLGDCLLKNGGALVLASTLQLAHQLLEEIILDHNEIKRHGASAILEAVRNKKKLSKLSLDGNEFGNKFIDEIKSVMKSMNKESALGSFSEDEGEDDVEEDEGDDNEYDEDEDYEQIPQSEDAEELCEPEVYEYQDVDPIDLKIHEILKEITPADFLQFPSPERFLALETDHAQIILNEVTRGSADGYVDRLTDAALKVAGLVTEWSVSCEAIGCAHVLLRELFTGAQSRDQLSLANNSLLVHLGLIKAENKKRYPEYNEAACRMVLDEAFKQNYLPRPSQDIIKCFLDKSRQGKQIN